MNYFSPKIVAEALDVSEASIKRWCDSGLIPASKTAGGHRKIALNDLIQLVQSGKIKLVHPQKLNINKASDEEIKLTPIRNRLKTYLLLGNKDAFKMEVFSLYLSGLSVVQIYDGLLSYVFQSIGQDWELKKIDVYHERRAVEICKFTIQLLNETFLKKTVGKSLGKAIVFSFENDFYELPILMLESVLLEKSWTVEVLGAHIPSQSIEDYLEGHKIQMACLSLSHVPNSDEVLKACKNISKKLFQQKSMLIVGGREVFQELREKVPHALFFHSMSQLETLLLSQNNIRSIK